MNEVERKDKILAVLGAHDEVNESELQRMDVGGFKARKLIQELCDDGHSITASVDAKGTTKYRLAK